MTSKEIFLSIVVPAYKEEKRIHIILEAIEKYIETKDFEIETIVVVDGSPDNTASVASAYSGRIKNLRVVDNKENHGKGYVVRQGMLEARGKYVLFTDADNSTAIEQVDKLLKFADQYPVVIGSRYTKDGKLAKPQPLSRRIGSRGLNMIIQLLAARGIKDTQCGFKLFQNEAAKNIFSKQTIERFSFDIEILAIARKLGYKVKEAGIVWRDNPHSTVKPLKDGFKMIGDSWQIRKNILVGRYK